MAEGARVLVVDDDRHDARLLAELLGAAGFSVGSIADPSRAPKVVLGEHVSVVLSSSPRHGVRRTTGLVVDLRSRPEPPLRDAGIVALVDDERDVRFGLGVEADAVLVRPFAAQALADAVTEVASTDPHQRRRRRAAAAAAQGARSRGDGHHADGHHADRDQVASTLSE